MDNARAAQIAVQFAAPRRGVPHASQLRLWASAALATNQGAVCLRIVGTTESRRLNRQWRDKNKSTNVLSFPYVEARERRSLKMAGRLLGDVVICAPVVQREAREQDKPLSAHWAHMVVHGVLHILGYDHIKTRDAQRMEAREVEILTHFGYQDPYVSPIFFRGDRSSYE